MQSVLPNFKPGHPSMRAAVLESWEFETKEHNDHLTVNSKSACQIGVKGFEARRRSDRRLPRESHVIDMGTHRNTPLALIVDDDPMSRVFMNGSLKRAGLRVEDAENGIQALAAFDQLRPDIVLMDVVMPEMDGFSACAALRNLPGGERIPVLMVTGLEDRESIRRAYEVGATDFITKPIKPMILEHRVRYMLRASAAYEELCRSKIRLTEAQRIARLGNWEWDVERNVFHCSEELYHIFGSPHREAGGTFETFLKHVHPEDRHKLERAMEAILYEGTPFSIDHRTLLPDGTERFVHQQAEATLNKEGKPIHIAGTVQDISERKRNEERIIYLACHDTLTGLPNRRFFKACLQKELAHAERRGKMMALFFLDLDRFKCINDTLGHDAGDQLLHQVAERIVKCVRKSDSLGRIGGEEQSSTVTRQGGDEFAVLLTDMHRIEDAAKVARRILQALTAPFEIVEQEVFIGASIGIALHPFDGKDADTLLKRADMAMFHAKDQGRNNYQFYADSMNAVAFDRLSLENDLRRALENDEFVLHYQPQVCIQTGKIVGLEALIRWEHPTKGLVSPAEFIPLAEETGLIVPIGEWVLRTACAQNQAWQAAGFAPLRMAVNLSSRQFQQKELNEIITQILDDTGLDRNWLEVELTEGCLMENTEVTVTTLRPLKAMGIGISIDDFGTGYSSLGRLKHFPIDTLKIDRSFVKDISTDPDDTAIITAILAMAKSLNLQVVAEGVETEAQLNFLRASGCETMQGYLFSPPVPGDEITEFLKKGKRLQHGPT